MKNAFIGAIVGAVLVGGGYLVGAAVHSATAPQQQTDQQPGAVSSPDIQGNQYSVGGLVQYEYHVAMRPNASTTCAVVSPNATTSLSFNAQKVASSTTGANIFEVGYDPSSSFATTTLIGGTMHIAAGAQISSVGSTTNANQTSIILAPNTHVNVKVGIVASSTPVGTCDYKFNVL